MNFVFPEEIRRRLGALRPPLRITASEREMLELLAGGKTEAQIAKLRGVTVQTVANSAARIRRKLGVSREVLMALLRPAR